ncbi:MAG: hypothetical protein FWC47_09380 [Oscillospiraceae bacterium]|nr:hypothetical protein [Oscillospiraceae bacterium]
MYTVKIKALFIFYVIIYFFVINNAWSFIIKEIAFITKSVDMQNFNVVYFVFGFIIVLPLAALFVSILFKIVKKNEKRFKDGLIKKWQYYLAYLVNILILFMVFSFFWNEILGILAYQFNIFNGIFYLIGLYFLIPCISILICLLSFRLVIREYYPKE